MRLLLLSICLLSFTSFSQRGSIKVVKEAPEDIPVFDSTKTHGWGLHNVSSPLLFHSRSNWWIGYEGGGFGPTYFFETDKYSSSFISLNPSFQLFLGSLDKNDSTFFHGIGYSVQIKKRIIELWRCSFLFNHHFRMPRFLSTSQVLERNVLKSSQSYAFGVDYVCNGGTISFGIFARIDRVKTISGDKLSYFFPNVRIAYDIYSFRRR